MVLGVINGGEIDHNDFVRRGDTVALKPAGRRALIVAYLQRVETEVRHPVFGYSISYRRVIEVQARLLARHLGGELAALPPFRTR